MYPQITVTGDVADNLRSAREKSNFDGSQMLTITCKRVVKHYKRSILKFGGCSSLTLQEVLDASR